MNSLRVVFFVIAVLVVSWLFLCLLLLRYEQRYGIIKRRFQIWHHANDILHVASVAITCPPPQKKKMLIKPNPFIIKDYRIKFSIVSDTSLIYSILIMLLMIIFFFIMWNPFAFYWNIGVYYVLVNYLEYYKLSGIIWLC